jgi:hypothetical protein
LVCFVIFKKAVINWYQESLNQLPLGQYDGRRKATRAASFLLGETGPESRELNM